jgi:putative ABC transport system permease protein
MTLGDLARFSAGALRGHRLRTGLSLVGVAIGVASVILLTSLGEGARRYVVGEFSALGTNLLIVIPGKIETTGAAPIMGGVPRDLTLEDAEAMERWIREIRMVAPMAMGEAPARFGQKSRYITVVGTTAEMQTIRQLVIRTGRYLPDDDMYRGQRVCVIGSKIQQEIFGGDNPLGQMLRLGDNRYQVIGVIAPRGRSVGMDMDEFVHVPVTQGLRMFNRSGLFRILVEVNSHDAIQPAKEAIIDLLRKRHDNVEDVTVLTQDAVLSTFGRILTVLTFALGGIAAISLSVAGIGIMNVMLVSVSERTREIGLLKALGAGRGQILTVFLAEASMLSTAGGLLGLAVGMAGVRSIVALYPVFPAQPPMWAVAGGLALAFLTGLVFGSLPARRAAGLDPVAALAGR